MVAPALRPGELPPGGIPPLRESPVAPVTPPIPAHARPTPPPPPMPTGPTPPILPPNPMRIEQERQLREVNWSQAGQAHGLGTELMPEMQDALAEALRTVQGIDDPQESQQAMAALSAIYNHQEPSMQLEGAEAVARSQIQRARSLSNLSGRNLELASKLAGFNVKEALLSNTLGGQPIQSGMAPLVHGLMEWSVGLSEEADRTPGIDLRDELPDEAPAAGIQALGAGTPRLLSYAKRIQQTRPDAAVGPPVSMLPMVEGARGLQPVNVQPVIEPLNFPDIQDVTPGHAPTADNYEDNPARAARKQAFVTAALAQGEPFFAGYLKAAKASVLQSTDDPDLAGSQGYEVTVDEEGRAFVNLPSQEQLGETIQVEATDLSNTGLPAEAGWSFVPSPTATVGFYLDQKSERLLIDPTLTAEREWARDLLKERIDSSLGGGTDHVEEDPVAFLRGLPRLNRDQLPAALKMAEGLLATHQTKVPDWDLADKMLPPGSDDWEIGRELGRLLQDHAHTGTALEYGRNRLRDATKLPDPQRMHGLTLTSLLSGAADPDMVEVATTDPVHVSPEDQLAWSRGRLFASRHGIAMGSFDYLVHLGNSIGPLLDAAIEPRYIVPGFFGGTPLITTQEELASALDTPEIRERMLGPAWRNVPIMVSIETSPSGEQTIYDFQEIGGWSGLKLRRRITSEAAMGRLAAPIISDVVDVGSSEALVQALKNEAERERSEVRMDSTSNELYVTQSTFGEGKALPAKLLQQASKNKGMVRLFEILDDYLPQLRTVLEQPLLLSGIIDEDQNGRLMAVPVRGTQNVDLRGLSFERGRLASTYPKTPYTADDNMMDVVRDNWMSLDMLNMMNQVGHIQRVAEMTAQQREMTVPQDLTKAGWKFDLPTPEELKTLGAKYTMKRLIRLTIVHELAHMLKPDVPRLAELTPAATTEMRNMAIEYFTMAFRGHDSYHDVAMRAIEPMLAPLLDEMEAALDEVLDAPRLKLIPSLQRFATSYRRGWPKGEATGELQHLDRLSVFVDRAFEQARSQTMAAEGGASRGEPGGTVSSRGKVGRGEGVDTAAVQRDLGGGRGDARAFHTAFTTNIIAGAAESLQSVVADPIFASVMGNKESAIMLAKSNPKGNTSSEDIIRRAVKEASSFGIDPRIGPATLALHAWPVLNRIRPAEAITLRPLGLNHPQANNYRRPTWFDFVLYSRFGREVLQQALPFEQLHEDDQRRLLELFPNFPDMKRTSPLLGHGAPYGVEPFNIQGTLLGPAGEVLDQLQHVIQDADFRAIRAEMPALPSPHQPDPGVDVGAKLKIVTTKGYLPAGQFSPTKGWGSAALEAVLRSPEGTTWTPDELEGFFKKQGIDRQEVTLLGVRELVQKFKEKNSEEYRQEMIATLQKTVYLGDPKLYEQIFPSASRITKGQVAEWMQHNQQIFYLERRILTSDTSTTTPVSEEEKASVHPDLGLGRRKSKSFPDFRQLSDDNAYSQWLHIIGQGHDYRAINLAWPAGRENLTAKQRTVDWKALLAGSNIWDKSMEGKWVSKLSVWANASAVIRKVTEDEESIYTLNDPGDFTALYGGVPKPTFKTFEEADAEMRHRIQFRIDHYESNIENSDSSTFFSGGHFDSWGVESMVHLRISTLNALDGWPEGTELPFRVERDADGRITKVLDKVMLVHEMQSDWEARIRGSGAKVWADHPQDVLQQLENHLRPAWLDWFASSHNRNTRLRPHFVDNPDVAPLPDDPSAGMDIWDMRNKPEWAPYIKHWVTQYGREPSTKEYPWMGSGPGKQLRTHQLAIKWLMRYAVENGFRFIAWTGGQGIRDMYSLPSGSKDTLVQYLTYNANSRKLEADSQIFANGQSHTFHPIEALETVLPKRLADAFRKLVDVVKTERDKRFRVVPVTSEMIEGWMLEDLQPNYYSNLSEIAPNLKAAFIVEERKDENSPWSRHKINWPDADNKLSYGSVIKEGGASDRRFGKRLDEGTSDLEDEGQTVIFNSASEADTHIGQWLTQVENVWTEENIGPLAKARNPEHNWPAIQLQGFEWASGTEWADDAYGAPPTWYNSPLDVDWGKVPALDDYPKITSILEFKVEKQDIGRVWTGKVRGSLRPTVWDPVKGDWKQGREEPESLAMVPMSPMAWRTLSHQPLETMGKGTPADPSSASKLILYKDMYPKGSFTGRGKPTKIEIIEKKQGGYYIHNKTTGDVATQPGRGGPEPLDNFDTKAHADKKMKHKGMKKHPDFASLEVAPQPRAGAYVVQFARETDSTHDTLDAAQAAANKLAAAYMVPARQENFGQIGKGFDYIAKANNWRSRTARAPEIPMGKHGHRMAHQPFPNQASRWKLTNKITGEEIGRYTDKARAQLYLEHHANEAWRSVGHGLEWGDVSTLEVTKAEDLGPLDPVSARQQGPVAIEEKQGTWQVQEATNWVGKDKEGVGRSSIFGVRVIGREAENEFYAQVLKEENIRGDVALLTPVQGPGPLSWHTITYPRYSKSEAAVNLHQPLQQAVVPPDPKTLFEITDMMLGQEGAEWKKLAETPTQIIGGMFEITPDVVRDMRSKDLAFLSPKMLPRTDVTFSPTKRALIAGETWQKIWNQWPEELRSSRGLTPMEVEEGEDINYNYVTGEVEKVTKRKSTVFDTGSKLHSPDAMLDIAADELGMELTPEARAQRDRERALAHMMTGDGWSKKKRLFRVLTKGEKFQALQIRISRGSLTAWDKGGERQWRRLSPRGWLATGRYPAYFKTYRPTTEELTFLQRIYDARNRALRDGWRTHLDVVHDIGKESPLKDKSIKALLQMGEHVDNLPFQEQVEWGRQLLRLYVPKDRAKRKGIEDWNELEPMVRNALMKFFYKGMEEGPLPSDTPMDPVAWRYWASGQQRKAGLRSILRAFQRPHHVLGPHNRIATPEDYRREKLSGNIDNSIFINTYNSYYTEQEQLMKTLQEFGPLTLAAGKSKELNRALFMAMNLTEGDVSIVDRLPAKGRIFNVKISPFKTTRIDLREWVPKLRRVFDKLIRGAENVEVERFRVKQSDAHSTWRTVQTEMGQRELRAARTLGHAPTAWTDIDPELLEKIQHHLGRSDTGTPLGGPGPAPKMVWLYGQPAFLSTRSYNELTRLVTSAKATYNGAQQKIEDLRSGSLYRKGYFPFLYEMTQEDVVRHLDDPYSQFGRDMTQEAKNHFLHKRGSAKETPFHSFVDVFPVYLKVMLQHQNSERAIRDALRRMAQMPVADQSYLKDWIASIRRSEMPLDRRMNQAALRSIIMEPSGAKAVIQALTRKNPNEALKQARAAGHLSNRMATDLYRTMVMLSYVGLLGPIGIPLLNITEFAYLFMEFVKGPFDLLPRVLPKSMRKIPGIGQYLPTTNTEGKPSGGPVQWILSGMLKGSFDGAREFASFLKHRMTGTPRHYSQPSLKGALAIVHEVFQDALGAPGGALGKASIKGTPRALLHTLSKAWFPLLRGTEFVLRATTIQAVMNQLRHTNPDFSEEDLWHEARRRTNDLHAAYTPMEMPAQLRGFPAELWWPFHRWGAAKVELMMRLAAGSWTAGTGYLGAPAIEAGQRARGAKPLPTAEPADVDAPISGDGDVQLPVDREGMGMLPPPPTRLPPRPPNGDDPDADPEEDEVFSWWNRRNPDFGDSFAPTRNVAFRQLFQLILGGAGTASAMAVIGRYLFTDEWQEGSLFQRLNPLDIGFWSEISSLFWLKSWVTLSTMTIKNAMVGLNVRQVQSMERAMQDLMWTIPFLGRRIRHKERHEQKMLDLMSTMDMDPQALRQARMVAHMRRPGSDALDALGIEPGERMVARMLASRFPSFGGIQVSPGMFGDPAITPGQAEGLVDLQRKEQGMEGTPAAAAEDVLEGGGYLPE